MEILNSKLSLDLPCDMGDSAGPIPKVWAQQCLVLVAQTYDSPVRCLFQQSSATRLCIFFFYKNRSEVFIKR